VRVNLDCHFFFFFFRELARNVHADNSEVSIAGKIVGYSFCGQRRRSPHTWWQSTSINAFRSMCSIFKRCLRQIWTHTLYVIPRRETSLWLLICLFCFLLQFAYRWGKRWPFCLLSFFFLFFFTRWGKPLIRKSPTNVRSNKWKKERHHGFDLVSVAKVL